MARSRSSVPPTTGTAIAANRTESEAANTTSIRAAPLIARRGDRCNGGRSSVTGRLFALRRDNDQRLQFQEALLADALHVHQILDALEAAALGAVLDDALRR